MPEPLISVVIPNRNRHGVVDRAVESVLAQEGVDFELLLVDDASDQPPTQLYERLIALGHQVLSVGSRQGPGPCRNLGAARARGRYLCFLDSDDHWLPGKLAQQLSSLRRSGLRIGQVAEIWYRNGVEVKPLRAHRVEAGDLYHRSLKAICVSPSSVMLERSLFVETGGFDEELWVCEDYDLWLRVAALQLFDAVMVPLVVKVGGHPDQLSRLLPAMDRFRIRSLAKGLRNGAFGSRWQAAADQLIGKARILQQGAAKRGRGDAVAAGDAVCQAILAGDWEAGDRWSRQLMRLWPVAPEVEAG